VPSLTIVLRFVCVTDPMTDPTETEAKRHMTKCQIFFVNDHGFHEYLFHRKSIYVSFFISPFILVSLLI
jgi:hypothetical protein